MTFDWDYAWRILPDIAMGAITTVYATLIGMVIACVLGLAICVAGYVPSRPVRWVNKWIGEFLRNTPLLVQLFALYYLLPHVGITLPAFQTGVVALGLQYAAYVAETYRAGIDSVSRGQWEACTALSMPVRRTWLRIVIPQAFPRILPALGTFLISMFKDSPLLFTIGVSEMLARAMAAGGRTYQYTEPIMIVGVFFLIMSVVSAYGVNVLSRRLGQKTPRSRGDVFGIPSRSGRTPIEVG